jgi:hypothetical protein
VSLEDIQERVDIMQKELDLEISGSVAADTSNLMRLIQGTVMPQVHTYICCVLYTHYQHSISFRIHSMSNAFLIESDTSHLASSINTVSPFLR